MVVAADREMVVAQGVAVRGTVLLCSRCKSKKIKFCYFNNYNVNQPATSARPATTTGPSMVLSAMSPLTLATEKTIPHPQWPIPIDPFHNHTPSSQARATEEDDGEYADGRRW